MFLWQHLNKIFIDSCIWWYYFFTFTSIVLVNIVNNCKIIKKYLYITFQEELPFLKNYRNPCWRELDLQENESRIRCLPYFFLVGAPKCGTTDLAKRISKHPLISAEVKKELHWLTRRRFHKDSLKMPCFPSQCSASDLGKPYSICFVDTFILNVTVITV